MIRAEFNQSTLCDSAFLENKQISPDAICVTALVFGHCACLFCVQVCENGLVLFDLTSTIRYPQTFPANWSTTPTVFAPYWCLADNSYSRTLSTALRSNVWYHEYSNAIGQVPSQADYQILSAIDALVTAKYHGNSSFQYRSRWALIVTWERITPYPSIYRYQLVSESTKLPRSNP